ncbi:MAG: hypothetical protein GBAus27B_000277 [Mycoplasmataceae bacterium]|nr:MAG: hypothetical protein GBAus27B_000277 [Mycoplasmataceae bacterium]
MSFTEKQQQTITENPNQGITATIAGYLPLLTLVFEQVTGQTIPQAKGTLADIQITLQKLEAKFEDFARNCQDQFIHQEKQLANLQQVSELISSKETKSIRFGNAKQITNISEDD